MAVYPTYKVAGVDMDDPSGRWELVDGTRVLPSFPGRKVVNWDLPGMVGNQSAAYAPGESATVAIKLRINAVGAVANTIVSGGSYERLKALRDNIDLLFYSIGLARQGYEGLVAIRHYASGLDYRQANGRMVSSTEPEFDAFSDHAYLTLMFDIPAGVWGSPSFDVTKATLPVANKGYKIKIPTGTAPSVENWVSFTGGPNALDSKWGQRMGVKNQAGVGFKLGVQGKSAVVPAGKWAMVNTLQWKYGIGTNGTAWGTPKPFTGLIEPEGRPTGSALTILPGTERGYGYVWAWAPTANAQIIIRSRKMWY
ncbi:hypothetical protein AUR04nite_00590 [Glutamicibacter uratoxydans]|uniref:Uncharacterized protein n=1 Tax=Glutamicibacter uratoxydans TaxID=43667 RepID=A0A4Y4DIS5_GLUUR|nr:hypothetical protein [Glutamicibacter uratoxydans]GED04527.1 hypothetical protein AUR04nite_00590 [Glutamicibacter uratoxydans]